GRRRSPSRRSRSFRRSSRRRSPPRRSPPRRSPPRRSPPRRSSRRDGSRRRSPPRRSPPRKRSPSPRGGGSRSRRSPSKHSYSPEWRKGSEKAKTEEKEPEAKADDDDGAEITTAIIDGIPRSSGENTYRAEVNVPRENGSGPLGKRGLTAIRGPNRIDKGKAEDDVRLLVDAFKRGGPPEVRKQQKE
ncbi:unnamed protein product, partial [Effrenium voratum]